MSSFSSRHSPLQFQGLYKPAITANSVAVIREPSLGISICPDESLP